MVQSSLTPELRAIALKALDAYLHALPASGNRPPVEIEAELDRNRVDVIEKTLKPLIAEFLEQKISVAVFKQKIDSTNKNNNHWGFTGIKGQMFFNLLLRSAKDEKDEIECDKQLKSAIRAPSNEQDAVTQLKNFYTYVTRIAQQFTDRGGSPHSKPNPSSVPFFVSYFWQIQRREVWPVYYTSTVQMFADINLWVQKGDLADDYRSYKRLNDTLRQLFSEAVGRPVSLYDVEHVFWFKTGKMSLEPATKPGRQNPTIALGKPVISSQTPAKQPDQASLLPDGYVPPIVGIIPRLAKNDAELQQLARRSGTTLERALEKSINAAFTMLGYETKLLGQGMGRVPDGQAKAADESYALLWDAKARSDGYRMGTDDRTIHQYVETQSKGLKKQGVRNIYYLIISSVFSDEFDDLIRALKMGTNVNEVCLVEADALVAIVDQRLRDPLNVSLGSDGIQRLFSSSGIIKRNDVLEILT